VNVIIATGEFLGKHFTSTTRRLNLLTSGFSKGCSLYGQSFGEFSITKNFEWAFIAGDNTLLP
jgi:hypothetical protein